MEHQEILNLVNEPNDSKFVTRKWNIVNDQSNASYDVRNENIYNIVSAGNYDTFFENLLSPPDPCFESILFILCISLFIQAMT